MAFTGSVALLRLISGIRYSAPPRLPSLQIGASMLPTFKPEGDVVLVERISHRMNQLKPGGHANL